MNIPLINLKDQFAPLRAEMLASLERIVDSQQFALGPEVKALEDEVAQYSNVKHAIGCASGSDALLLALMALDVKAGDEVITASFTFLCHRRRDCAPRGAAGIRRYRSAYLHDGSATGRGGDHTAHAGHYSGSHVRPLR